MYFCCPVVNAVVLLLLLSSCYCCCCRHVVSVVVVLLLVFQNIVPFRYFVMFVYDNISQRGLSSLFILSVTHDINVQTIENLNYSIA